MRIYARRPFKLNLDFHEKMIPKDRIIHRIAARAIILEDQQIYMIYSKKFHDLKFPGGGVQENETLAQALSREVLEETGIIIQSQIEYLGEVQELRQCFDPGYDLMVMNSYYFAASISQMTNQTNFDFYEKTYDYVLRKVTIDEAIEINAKVVDNKEIPWCKRELEVLKNLKDF